MVAYKYIKIVSGIPCTPHQLAIYNLSSISMTIADNCLASKYVYDVC